VITRGRGEEVIGQRGVCRIKDAAIVARACAPEHKHRREEEEEKKRTEGHGHYRIKTHICGLVFLSSLSVPAGSWGEPSTYTAGINLLLPWEFLAWKARRHASPDDQLSL
jgi:hypothetical protein